MNKFQQLVLKHYPNAYLDYSEDGYVVLSDGIFLAEEYLMPNTYDPDKAWEYAAMCCKITQNFNRTHPLRMDLSSIEQKMGRINQRKRKSYVRAAKTKTT